MSYKSTEQVLREHRAELKKQINLLGAEVRKIDKILSESNNTDNQFIAPMYLHKPFDSGMLDYLRRVAMRPQISKSRSAIIRERVMAFLKESPEGAAFSDIHNYVEEAGIDLAKNSVSNTMNIMKNQETIKYVGKRPNGRWMLSNNRETGEENESDDPQENAPPGKTGGET